MRTFLGSHQTLHKKTNTILRHTMSAAAEHRVDAGLVNAMVGCALGMGDMVIDGELETEQEERRTEGSPVIWGEFQGTQQNEGNGEIDWYKRGLPASRPEENWVAFRDAEEPQMDEQEKHITQHDGHWWCEDSTMLCTREYSIDKSSVGHIFEQCFPPVLHPHVEEDVQPLELLLHDTGPGGPNQTWRRNSCDHRSAGCLWGLSDHPRDPDCLYKWEESQLCSAYLSSLHIDPNDKAPTHVEALWTWQAALILKQRNAEHPDPLVKKQIPPHRTKFPTSSPAPKQRPQLHKLSTGLGREPELKLTKVASVSVHVTGFSPSHHLQSLFQHWSQPNGKTRLKVAYDFNRSLLV